MRNVYNRYTVVAHVEIWWLMWRCGGSCGDVVAHVEMWWLMWRCGGSCGDLLAHYEMW